LRSIYRLLLIARGLWLQLFEHRVPAQLGRHVHLLVSVLLPSGAVSARWPARAARRPKTLSRPKGP